MRNFKTIETETASIPYREVYIKDYVDSVKVTTEEMYNKYIKEDSSLDNIFYCYIPKKEFTRMSNDSLSKFINTHFT